MASLTRKPKFSNVLLSGAGFLADAYDLFVINVAVDLMSAVSYKQPMTAGIKALIKSIALIGAVVGQIAFGIAADIVGRKKVFVATCALVILGSFMSAVVQNTSGPFGIYSQIVFWRFWLGVGVGGEYPLSASVASENSSDEDKIRNLTIVFSMQGLGTILCSLVLVAVTYTLHDDYNSQWRVALGLGAVPMVIAFYFRWKMNETVWKEESRKLDAANNPSSMASSSYFEEIHAASRKVWSIISENRWKLVGTCGSWFILDVVFYGNGLFSGQVVKAMRIVNSARGEALASLILQTIAYPGYICSILFAKQIGLKRLQLVGFIFAAVIFFILAGLQPRLVKIPGLYIFLYGITFFFQNFGPNATTYVIPSVIFSVVHKATCHGLSAAFGKLGAILGAQVFIYLQGAYCTSGVCKADSPSRDVDKGVQLTFIACGSTAVFGLIWSYIFVGDGSTENGDDNAEAQTQQTTVSSPLTSNDAFKDKHVRATGDASI